MRGAIRKTREFKRCVRRSSSLLAGLVIAIAPLRPTADDAPKGAETGGPTALQSVLVQAPRKIDLPLLTEPVVETPQTITLITSQMIAVGGLSDLRDVLKLDVPLDRSERHSSIRVLILARFVQYLARSF